MKIEVSILTQPGLMTKWYQKGTVVGYAMADTYCHAVVLVDGVKYKEAECVTVLHETVPSDPVPRLASFPLHLLIILSSE